MSKPGADPSPGTSSGGCPEDCPSGIRHVGGAKLNLALVWNVRTWPAMPREKAQAAPTARPKVPMRGRGADCLVVAMKQPRPYVRRYDDYIAAPPSMSAQGPLAAAPLRRRRGS